MKNWITCLLLLTPLLAAAQKSRCEDMIARAEGYLARDVLDDALSEYISALNCNTRLSTVLAPKIQNVFLRIQAEKKRIEILRDKQDQLLGYFFTDPAHEGEGFSNGANNLAWVQNPNSGKYAVIDRQGERHGEYVWEDPQPFKDGIAIARRGGEYYFVDGTGTAASREGYDFLHITSIDPLFGIQQTDSGPLTWVLNARNGNKRQRIRFWRKGFSKASEDIFPVQEDGKWNLVSTDGRKIGPAYDSLGLVYDGYARVQRDSLWGFVDTRGEVPEWGAIQYDEVGPFADSIAWARSGKKYYLIDLGRPKDRVVSLESRSLIAAYQEYFDRHVYDNRLQEIEKLPPMQQVQRTAQRGQAIGEGEEIFIREVKGETRNINLYQLNNKYYLTYGEGQSQQTALFDAIQPVTSEVFLTRQRTYRGLLVFDRTGSKATLKKHLPVDYQDIGSYQENPNYIRIKQDGKWGYAFWDEDCASERPCRIIPCKYDLATDFFEKPGFDELVARVYVARFNLYFYINTKGEMLAEIERDRIW